MGVIIYFLVIALKEIREDFNRELANVTQLMSDQKDMYLEISDKQNKEIALLKDTLVTVFMEKEKLKSKQILRTINNKYNNSYDTTITMIINPIDTTYRDFRHRFDPCIELIGRVNWGKNIIVVDSLDVSINTSIIDYWERKRPWLWIFSKKKYYSMTVNNCKEESKTREIKFIKH